MFKNLSGGFIKFDDKILTIQNYEIIYNERLLKKAMKALALSLKLTFLCC